MQLTPEEIAAVERLRRHTGGDTSVYEHWQDEDGPYLNPRGCISLMEDEEKLTRLALRLLAADDETPVDEAWLRSVGGTKEDHRDKITFYRDDALPIGLWHVDDGWKAMLISTPVHATCIVRGLKTRGGVRRLCRALGISLQETPTP